MDFAVCVTTDNHYEEHRIEIAGMVGGNDAAFIPRQVFQPVYFVHENGADQWEKGFYERI